MKLFLLFISLFPLCAQELIHGDGFRSYADHVYDERSPLFSPEKVKPFDLVFVGSRVLQVFFHQIHPQIQNPYFLLSHNSGKPIPDRFAPFLDDPKLLAWFGINASVAHPKLILLPLGFANPSRTKTLPVRPDRPVEKKHLLYLNFTLRKTGHGNRQDPYDLFREKSYCYVSPFKSHREYLQDLAESQFVLSPFGTGLDCYRTWEAIWMGAIPIILSSPIDPLFAGLPVLILKSWDEITELFLYRKYEEIGQRTYNLEKLDINYWLKKIEAVRSAVRIDKDCRILQEIAGL